MHDSVRIAWNCYVDADCADDLISRCAALEYQGSDHAELNRMRKDLTRFTDLRREGWLAFAYGPAEVFGWPWEIESDVRRAVRDRAPHLLLSRRRVVSYAPSGH